jgi:three-Cys-motif partner protein
MSSIKETIWKIEPHTKAKHEILRKYLGAWFGIMGRYNQNVLFIDGFCGPGRYIGGEAGSPLIALHTAISHNTKNHIKKATFVFIDNDKERIEYLKFELSKMTIPSNFKIFVFENEFEATISSILDDIEKEQGKLMPAFVFIDPFGFKGAPFSLVKRLLMNPKTEVFINIMVDFINRFVETTDPKTCQHIIDLFGTKTVIDVINGGGNRIYALIELYKNQLLTSAKYVRYFEMKDYSNRIIYSLFFATNNELGHVKMKEALWAVDNQSGINFSDATNKDQLVLFNLDPSDEIGTLLLRTFANQRVVVKNLLTFIENKTPYVSKHLRKALKRLEDSNKICVEPCKKDGTKRHGNSFPEDVIINFI